MPPSESRIFEIALCNIPKIGPQLARQLIAYCGSAENVFREKPGKLLKIPGIGRQLIQNIQKADHLKAAEEAVRTAEAYNTRILFYTDTDFPARLKDVYDAPLLLYYTGKADLNAPRTIAIVGTRQATDYGKELTLQLIKSLIPWQPVVVSGLAYGIDAAAHTGALQNGLPTIGVMATGTDTVYPSVHKKMAAKMLEQGGLLTEYPPGSRLDPMKFPARNRIIAALSDATVVVEAAEKGGALITADIANSYDREVFALPGNLSNKYSTGCNHLIKSHQAHILTDPADIPAYLNWNSGETPQAPPPASSKAPPDHLSEPERKIYSCLLEQDVLMIDEICWKSQLPINQVSSLLLNMELLGVVRPVPGKKYKLVYPR